MSDDGHESGPTEPVRQPLPPEIPVPEPPSPAEEPAEAPAAGREPEAEWWRAPAGADGEPAEAHPVPPNAPPPPTEPPAAGASDGAPAPDPQQGGSGGPDWWQGDQVRGELHDAWSDASTEAGVAAQELGYQLQHAAGTISDAVAGVAYPAAARRGLDIRWMRLSINLPAIAISLLVTYGGRSATDRMVDTVAEGGIFAPLGWVLMAGLVLLAVLYLPLGMSWIGAMFSALVSRLTRGLLALVGWAWTKPGTGYVLRVLVAVAAWSVLFAVTVQVWRGVVHLLTGA
ncbi:hypothetical protein ABZ820_33785 [Streptomyces diacarni]|uniref:hypothetical protein n=1 Tax=Streptomyces diacarni TaxID=2800381 RepID=UPI003409E86D